MMLPRLTPLEAQVVEKVLASDKFSTATPLKAVAQAGGVSEAMVVKITKKLGFSGYRAFRKAVADYNQFPTSEMHRELSADDSIEEIVRKVFSTSIQAIEETRAILDLQALEAAARVLRSCRQHDFYGVGGSAQVARDISHKFLRIGVRTSVFDDPHLMLMSASLLSPGDAIVAFSHSGTTASVIEAARLGRSRGATLIAVTNYDGSVLAETADIVLCSTARGSPLTGENAAARIAQLNILDALFAAVAQGDYAAAEDNLNKTMSSVSANRRGTPS